MKVKSNRALFAAVMVIVAGFASLAQAQLLYEETFVPLADFGPIEDSGWTVDTPEGWYSGTYPGTFEPNFDVLRDAANNQPINGNTGVYIGVGGPVENALGMFYTIDGFGGFTTIDPADCERLILSIYANLQAGGGDDFGYFAVRLGDRTPQWYISSTPMAPPTQDGGELMDLRRLEFDPSASNWNELSLAPVAIGGPAGDLSGLPISGVGIVQSLTNPAPLPDFSNPEAFSSWNYADYRITCVPEPTAMALLSLAGLATLSVRRRRN